jgi:hypothetical protein
VLAVDLVDREKLERDPLFNENDGDTARAGRVRGTDELEDHFGGKIKGEYERPIMSGM